MFEFIMLVLTGYIAMMITIVVKELLDVKEILEKGK